MEKKVLRNGVEDTNIYSLNFADAQVLVAQDR